MVYVTIIVFAVIRVISAIFLKDTLDAAHNDAENLVFDRLKKKASYVRKLQDIFKAIDNTSDGMVTEDQLTSVLANPTVAAYFQTLDVESWLCGCDVKAYSSKREAFGESMKAFHFGPAFCWTRFLFLGKILQSHVSKDVVDSAALFHLLDNGALVWAAVL